MFLVVSLCDNLQWLMFDYFSEAIINTFETIASTKRIQVRPNNGNNTNFNKNNVNCIHLTVDLDIFIDG